MGNHGAQRRAVFASSRDRGCQLKTFIIYSNELQHNFLESLAAFKRERNECFVGNNFSGSTAVL